jgi:DNA-binding NtrC family response regulator
MKRILIVDDERNMCTVLSMLFADRGYEVATAGDGAEAIRLLERGEPVDLIISDLKMPGVDGIGILDWLKGTERDIPLILITAYGTIPDAVQAVKKGAVDFFTKPFNSDVIVHTVSRVFRTVELERSNRILSERIAEDRMVCESPQMRELLALVGKFAAASTPVLIMGESGVGKEMIARAMHCHAGSADQGAKKPFIVINCPAIPESLLESEMFGHQRGAFTGATKDHKGKVLLADGGTLFLDEVGDLPLSLQPKLLRVLEDKSFQPVGSNTTVRVSARVICTTNQDLERCVASGTFRRDLFYRINALTMHVPPLRERKADIKPLADYFLKKYSLEMKKDVRISDGVMEAFREYPWPGNVRELRNVVERAVVIVNSGAEIGLRDLPPEMSHGGRCAEPNRENRLETQERALIQEALRQSGWNISRAALALGIPRGNLRYRIDKFGLTNGEIPPSG